MLRHRKQRRREHRQSILFLHPLSSAGCLTLPLGGYQQSEQHLAWLYPNLTLLILYQVSMKLLQLVEQLQPNNFVS